MTCAPRLLWPEENVGNLKKYTFRNSGTPVRRTQRQKPHKMYFQEFWDSCAQNKTSEISKNALSLILGLLCAEQDVGNLKELHFQEFWDSCAQNKTSEISTNTLSRVLGLLCAEQDVGNQTNITFRNSGTPGRRTRRRKSENIHFQEFWDSLAQNKTSKISKKHFQEFWDSCAQNKTSEISKNTLSRVLGLLCAEQNIRNLKQMHFQEFWDSCAQNKASEI